VLRKETILVDRLLLALSFLVVAAAPGIGELSPTLKIHSDGDGLRVEAKVKECRASLERRYAEPRLLHFRNDCDQPLAEKVELLGRMIAELLPQAADRREIDSLFVGRLLLTFPDYARRLAKAASETPDWKPTRGWEDPGYANRVVREIANGAPIYLELQAVLRGLGYGAQVSGVEKVLMARPRDLAFADWLAAQGVDPNTRLPFDAMTWFRLSPVQRPKLHSPGNVE
jgi:hypothetical protein